MIKREQNPTLDKLQINIHQSDKLEEQTGKYQNKSCLQPEEENHNILILTNPNENRYELQQRTIIETKTHKPQTKSNNDKFYKPRHFKLIKFLSVALNENYKTQIQPQEGEITMA